MNQYEHHTHSFEPVYDKNSKVLILGTFPSVKSRENNFYYGHPQNRFWRVIAAISDDCVPETVAQKKELLLKNGIAIWDVIESCDIIGSSDSSIKNVVAADITRVLKNSSITKIYANGATAKKLYDKYSLKTTRCEIIQLPSTSPANAAWSFERLVDEWYNYIFSTV